MTQTIPDLTLLKGGHTTRESGVCLMEAVAYVAGEKHSDRPECASIVLGSFGRSLNDVLDDTKRQQLVPLVPKIVGTAGDGHDEERSYMALDWLIRTYTPAWLDLAGHTAEAHALRDLRRIVDMATAELAGPVVRTADATASAAESAAWSAARSAARSAAESAAWSAVRSAAESAARSAAWSALAPTVDQLQDSAIALFTQMVEVGK